MENTWKPARASHFHFPVVRRNICLEAFMVNFLVCAVLSVLFFFPSTDSFCSSVSLKVLVTEVTKI